MDNYEHLRIEYLLTKTLIQYKQNPDGIVDNEDEEELQRKMGEIKEARKLVDEMLSKAKLKELAINMAEVTTTKLASKVHTRNTRIRTGPRDKEMEAEDHKDFEKLKEIRDQVEAAGVKYELSKEAIKKLIESGPGLADILSGEVFNTDDDGDEEMDEDEDEEALDSERLKSLRVFKIHRANVMKANLLIRCFAQLPYSEDPRLGSAEMKRVRAVVDAVLSGSYEVNADS